MNFVTRLSIVQNGYDLIMIIVDILTKLAHSIPIKIILTTIDISRVFIEDVYRIHKNYQKG